MSQRSIKALVGLTGFVALSWFGGSAASADYPPDLPSSSQGPAVPTVNRPAELTGTLPATGADMGDAARIGLTALATGGVLVGVATRRRHRHLV